MPMDRNFESRCIKCPRCQLDNKLLQGEKQKCISDSFEKLCILQFFSLVVLNGVRTAACNSFTYPYQLNDSCK